MVHLDTLLFNRRLRITHWFKDSNSTTNDPFRTPTGWNPPSGKSAALDTFINVITTEVLKYKKKERHDPNLTEKESQALLNLSRNQNIVIKPADKRGAIVIMNTKDYIKEGLRQLSDTNFYQELPRNPTQRTSAEIQRFLAFIKDRNLLPKEHITFLTPKNPRTPLFYMLPKIHKPNNPGRPIVSTCDGPTENLSMYIDSFIKPLAQQVKSYIKDTNQFIQRLTELGQVPHNSYLVTIDVTSLYTSIPHKDGI